MYKKSFLSLMLISSCLKAQLDCQFFYMNFGSDFNYARYKLNNVASQGGYLAGPHFDIAYKRPCSVYSGLNFDGRWNAGNICSTTNLDNPNFLQGGNTQASVADFLTDWELGYYHLSCDERFTVMPYSGVGFQHLTFRLKPNIMRYKYNQVYVPVGLEFLYFSPRDFSVGFKADYRAGAYTRLKVSTPGVGSSGKLKLNYSQGVNVKAPITLYYLRDKCVGFHFAMIPFFDWNQFSNTSQVNGQNVQFPIPKLTRWYLGLNVNIGITF